MVVSVAQSLPSPETRREAAFGARVLVLFDDGKRYWGTINNHATSAQDRSHPDGPWSVLFDDCTQERFRDGDKDCKTPRVCWNLIIYSAGGVQFGDFEYLYGSVRFGSEPLPRHSYGSDRFQIRTNEFVCGQFF